MTGIITAKAQRQPDNVARQPLEPSLRAAQVGTRRDWTASVLVIRSRVLVMCSAARRTGSVDAVTIRRPYPARMDTCWQVRCGLAPS